MEKSFTLFDLYTYQQELEEWQKASSTAGISPDRQLVKNLLNYARALKVVTTRSAGHAYLLMN